MRLPFEPATTSPLWLLLLLPRGVRVSCDLWTPQRDENAFAVAGVVFFFPLLSSSVEQLFLFFFVVVVLFFLFLLRLLLGWWC